MARMLAPNDTMREVQIEGARTGVSKTYGWGKDGTVHVDSPAHIKALKDAGFTVAGVHGSGRGGFTCGCGFKSWFRTCSRCGCDGVRDV